MTVPAQLIATIRKATSKQAPLAIQALAKEIASHYGDATQAILFYGSCFRKADDSDGVADLYVLVDSYRHAYKKKSYALLNTLLPPNVFYFEFTFEKVVRRAKYSVFSFKDFQRGASGQWFHSYLWARAAQPMGLVYARNSHLAEQVHGAMASAALTFVSQVLPLMPSQFSFRDLWHKGLTLSYGAELRAERHDTIVSLLDANPDYYEELTRTALGELRSSVTAIESTEGSYYQLNMRPCMRMSSQLAWHLRRYLGKVFSVIHLLKGWYTFQGGLDYVLWKIERHSGVRVAIDHRLRKIPVVGVAVLFWRLYRRGAFH